jgi:AcrR family transcriptional regulator
VTGLRERKKRATRAAIHDAAMALFAARGFGATTIDQIAERADLSRATVFTHFATKEDIVFGDAPDAIEALTAMLAEPAAEQGTLATVRAWLRELTGWIEPELVVQLQLAREVPGVGARRLQIYRRVEDVIAAALRRELADDLGATLAASSLVAALRVMEETAAARMEQGGRALADAEIDALLDDALAFAEAGMAALAARGR